MLFRSWFLEDGKLDVGWSRADDCNVTGHSRKFSRDVGSVGEDS